MNKLIIFDMDGVIVDSMGLSKEELLRTHPGMTEEVIRDIHNGNFHEELHKAEETFPHVEETDEERTARWESYSRRKEDAPIFDGVIELLTDLHKKGYMLALNTSAYTPNSVPVLKKAGVLELFDFLGTAEVSKNKVEKFALIQAKYGTHYDNTLFVTDSLGDLRDADQAGVRTIGVTWGMHDASTFTREPHDNLVAVVETMDELEKCIESNV